MLDQGNDQLSAVGFFNPMMGGGEAVGVSGGSGGGGIGGVFDIEDGKLVRCALVFGRQWVQCDDTALPILGEDKTPTGVIYAEIDHSSTSLKLSVKHKADGNLPENSLQKSYRALYYAYSSGTPPAWSWADVRFQPAMFAMN
jgi:hypothetical protein